MSEKIKKCNGCVYLSYPFCEFGKKELKRVEDPYTGKVFYVTTWDSRCDPRHSVKYMREVGVCGKEAEHYRPTLFAKLYRKLFKGDIPDIGSIFCFTLGIAAIGWLVYLFARYL